MQQGHAPGTSPSHRYAMIAFQNSVVVNKLCNTTAAVVCQTRVSSGYVAVAGNTCGTIKETLGRLSLGGASVNRV